ncbi:hypothetical protein IRJ41_013372 [Triplophysa rosa]|uniref:Uncharacterized protein n=1 Tax=Triplophysa rosa TaxID=992332 RepID=A0A9W7WYZ8_TRIRA|nr:hypothetical protein IRJ41_013372 [Triplophysa rosa]
METCECKRTRKLTTHTQTCARAHTSTHSVLMETRAPSARSALKCVVKFKTT